MEVYGAKAKKSKTYIFCNSCRHDTNHTLQYAVSTGIGEYLESLEDEGQTHLYYLTWLIWRCDGCSELSLHLGGASVEQFDQSEFYPGDSDLWETAYHGGMPIMFEGLSRNLPDKLFHIFLETVTAYDNHLGILCTIGLRSTIEAICADKRIEGKNLNEKISNMIDIPLSQNIVDNLHSLRLMGNDAAHEFDAPDREEQQLAIEICESLFGAIYELDYRTSYLTELLTRKKGASIKPHSEDTGKIIPFRKPEDDQDEQPDGEGDS
jgi:hypothetical protein